MDVSDQRPANPDHNVTHNPQALNTISDQGKEALKDIVFGSFAGVIGKIIEYPFDTVKVRLQSQPDHLPLRYTGPLDCFKQSLKADGISGLYRGVSAPMFGAAVENSSLFFSYRLAQEFLQATVLPKAEEIPFSALLVCGATAGAFTSLLLTPIELVKCKLQVPLDATQAAWRTPTISTVIASIYKHQGISGFWHGQMGTFLRETGGSAAWFGSYEGTKLLYRRYDPRIHSDDDLKLWQRMTAGAMAGMSYNFIFYPADTIKSRMQTEDVSQLAKNGQRSFYAVAKSTYELHGLKGLYRGCGITVARSAPSSAVIFTIYEALKRNFS